MKMQSACIDARYCLMLKDCNLYPVKLGVCREREKTGGNTINYVAGTPMRVKKG